MRDPHRGGQQLPLLVPESSWRPPTELPDLRGRRLATDLETRDDALSAGRGPGWAHRAGCIVGVSLAWEGGAIYVPTRHPEDNYHEPENVPRWLADQLNAAPEVLFQNAPYDLGWLKADWNIDPPAKIGDTVAMAVMVDEERLSYDLDSLARWRGIPGKDESLLREAAAAYAFDPKKHLWRLPARYAGAYAEQDPVATLGIADDLAPVLKAEGTEAAYQLEMDLVPMVLEMRRRGIRIDLDGVQRGIERLNKMRDEVLAELGRNLGRGSVTIAHCRSPKQLREWFDAESVSYPYTAPTKAHPEGQPSFAKWMRGHSHWLPRLVARAEQLHEAAEKFLQGFILDYTHRGRLHANVNQFKSEEGGTRTHRFSYSDPPLQQMPHRDKELMLIIRDAFLPEENEWWLSADYSQQEYRLIVHYANMLGLRGAAEAAERYRGDPKTDFHQFVADITGLDRKPAKDANFAKSYGAGVQKFAEMTGRSVDEAREIMEQYDRELPFVSRLNQTCDQLAARRGYVRLLDGARIHFNNWEPSDRSLGSVPARSKEAMELWCDNFETTHGYRPRIKRAQTRKAMNGLIQGGAARQTKMAMRDCWREGLVPLLQMHDELDFSVTSSKQVQRVGEIMRSVAADELTVPFLTDLETGATWARVKSWDWAEMVAAGR